MARKRTSYGYEKGLTMKATPILLLIVVCCMSVIAFAAEKLSVGELLDRYAANQDRLSSFIAKTKTLGSAKWTNEDRPSFMRRIMEVRVDSERIHINTKTWYGLPSRNAPTPIENAKIFYHLWDGDIYMTYRVGLRVDMNRDEESIKQTVNVATIGLPFFGIRFSNNEPLDTVLRQAKTISVRDELERVGSDDCYIIDAKTASGTYTIWIDPQHDYQIAQAEIRVGPGEHFRFRPLGDNECRFLSIRNIRYENIEGIWIPMEADTHTEGIGPEPDSIGTIDNHHKITKITLNPDHEALGSFVPVITDGTTVIDRDSSIRYIWHEGMKFVVDEWDGRIRYVPKNWSIRAGVSKPLPEFEGIDLDITAEDIRDKAILLCFFNMNQRPSRNCLLQLSKRAQEPKVKDIAIVGVQVSNIDENDLRKWTKENNIPFPVGMIQGDQEKTRFTWGVRSLPWLILTDRDRIVRSEGFGIDMLEEEIKKISPLDMGQ
jgi:peroxiredoxin